MKVLFFARNTLNHPRPGGMEVVLDTLASALRAEGVATALVTTDGMHQTNDSHAQYDQVWQISGTRTGRYSARWWDATQHPGPWDRWTPDVAVGIGDAGGGYALREDRSAPIVIQSHGTPLMEAQSALASRSIFGLAQAILNVLRLPSRVRFYRHADGIWAIGEGVRRQIEKYRPDILYMPNAVDSTSFAFSKGQRDLKRKELEIATDTYVLLFLGRVERQKGVRHVLSALPRLTRTRDTKLIIAGNGSDVQALKRFSAHKGVSDHVIFLGGIERSEVQGLLSAADLFVLPTRRREGLPMALLEAAACGLPIVATEAAGTPSDLRIQPMVQVAKPGELWRSIEDASGLKNNAERRTYLPEQYTLSDYGARHLTLLEKQVGL